MIDRSEQFDLASNALLSGGPADQEFAELLALAEDLRGAPRPEFQAELRKELERIMSTTATYKRAEFRTVTPYIAMKNAAEVATFLGKTFGAELASETKMPNGTVHRELRMLGSMVMLGESLSIPGALHVFVDDVDATYERAIAAGAKLLMGDVGKPADRPYGERSAFVEDMAGNYWYIAKHINKHEPEDDTVVPYLHPRNATQLMDFLKAVFDAQELGVYKEGDRVMHAAVRIGDSLVEMGEAEEHKEQGLYVYVEDPDAVYKKALAAGGTSIYPPADHAYGERSGGFRDPAGNSWFISRLL
jgi:uncharacterized glyoxalase superfamily protein PhnB